MTKPSRMADLVAAMRAAHTLRDRPLVFEDLPAVSLIPTGWRWVCKNRLLYWAVFRRLLGSVYRPVQCQVLARSRFAEDKLAEAVRLRDVRQYVIVSAGLDSFCVRQPAFAKNLRIYEVDHPAMAQEKKKRLGRLATPVPRNVEFLTADLEHRSIAQAMAESPTFSFAEPAVLSWLGTTAYLTVGAIHGTLRSIRENFASGTLVVFDYLIPDELKEKSDRHRSNFLHRYAARRGELVLPGLEPDAFVRDVEALGLVVDEHLWPKDYRERYFAGRGDDLIPSGGSNLIALRVP